MSARGVVNEGTWSVFAEKVVAERDAALAEIATLQKHLKTMRGIADEWRAAYEDTEHGQKEREWQAEREHTASVVTALKAQVSALRETLKGIAWANRFDRSLFANDAEFTDWAQSRARHALLTEEPQS